MSAVIYLFGAVSVCCIAWLVVASTGLGQNALDLSWRHATLPVLASSLATATFLIARFVAVEAPVSTFVIVRGWLGFIVVLAVVFAAAAALMSMGARRARSAFGSNGHQPSAR